MENDSGSLISKLKGDINYLEKRVDELEHNERSQNTNIDNMRTYIKSLEEEVSTKSEQLIDKKKLLRKYQEEEDELNRMISNERNLSERIKKQSEAQIMERMRQL